MVYVGRDLSSVSGFRVQGAGCRVQGSGFRVQGSGCRNQGSGFRVQGAGFRDMQREVVHVGGDLRLGSGFGIRSLGFGV